MPAKLLIADDSTTIQKVFERTFPPEEFTLSFVNNGEEALAKAKADKPNLIIADINMPAKNGFELCEDLKKDPVLKGTPILLLIGILDDFDEDESRRVGADGFIVKPFEANAAISKVREALAKGGSALPKEGPVEGGAQEVMEMADIVTGPAAPAPPPQKKGAEDILDVAEILGEKPGTPTPPPEEQPKELMEMADIVTEPATAVPPPQKKGAEDILDVAEILGEKPGTPTPPTQEQTEEIMEMADIATEPTAAPPSQKKGAEDILDVAEILGETPTTPTPPTQEQTEEIMEMADIVTEPTATPTPPPQEKQQDEGFVLQTSSLRELEEELKAEFPEKKAEGEEELKTEFPEEKVEGVEDLSVQPKEEESVGLDLDLPFDDADLEPPAKNADWTGLFGELGIEEPSQETKNERLGTILDESTTELEKIEGLATPKQEKPEEEIFEKKFRDPFFGENALEPEKIEGPGTLKGEGKEDEFAEQFAEDFEPVFEPEENPQHIDTKEDLRMTATEGTEDLAEKVVSAVGHELKEVVEKVIKDKVPQLVRQEIDRLKKE